MVLKLEEAQALHARLAKASKADLDKEFDQKLEEQSTMRFEVDAKIKVDVIAFLDNEKMINGAYNQAGPFVSLHEKVSKEEDLNVIELRTLQKFLVEAKFSSVTEASLIHNLLKAMQPMNEKLGRLEETARAIGEYIQKAETAEKAGLEYKADDAETVAKGLEQATKPGSKPTAPKAAPKAKAKGKAKLTVK